MSEAPNPGMPADQGLYRADFERDSCGVGFVCNISGKRSHGMVADGLTVLRRLSHRGATGADPLTGDGAGLLIQTPDAFLRREAAAAGFELPPPGFYGAGLVFLPGDDGARQACREAFARAARETGQTVLGWRDVPTDPSVIGAAARRTMPVFSQVFVARGADCHDEAAFERRLYVLRRIVENEAAETGVGHFHVTGLSCRTLCYKGLLMPAQMGRFFPDLSDPAMESALCLVHSRYSTNTFPTWDLAQPFRFLAHNGEINTLRGNVNWTRAREGLLASPLFGADIGKIKPVIVPGGSDSAMLDNVFELLFLSGRPLAHAMMMLVPCAWERNPEMPAKVREFFRYHACLSEPWDGPAAVAFTDGRSIGAVLDRNGLRPARYIVTSDGTAVMASEVGVLDIPPARIVRSGRIEPGRMLFIDTAAGTIVSDDAIKETLADSRPYGPWLRANMTEFDSLPRAAARPPEPGDREALMAAFGYTREDVKVVLRPMALNGQEPIGSMGNDTPPAVLSRHPQTLYSYFKQLFAQVTNPAIDPIREELVMSLDSFLGPELNILDETPRHCRRLLVAHPVLDAEEMERLRAVSANGFRTRTISLLFPAGEPGAFMEALDRICAESAAAIADGATFIILSDRGLDAANAALPALLATGAVHHHLVRAAARTRISIVVESGEPREVHHAALLFGYGADCVHPWLAIEAVRALAADGEADGDPDRLAANYIKALHKGLLKILSKMGISTLRSYRGAQIFEALGLHETVVERCFAGTPSRIGGADFDVVARETLMRHGIAFAPRAAASAGLATGGVYQWKRDGEVHRWNPETIAALQDAVRADDYAVFKRFSGLVHDGTDGPVTLRNLFVFKPGAPVPLEEVEPPESILSRFATGAMSFGSISRAAHTTLAAAMNLLGGKSNTGEGGEDPARFIPLPNGMSLRSAIKQVASGRFGVTTNYLVNADELQIKIAQGAKPGEGGQLPGHKVSGIIARTRYTTPGVTLISPPPHHDIYSIEDLAQLIFDLKNVNPRARVSVKLVSEVGVGTVAAGVAKGRADMILISGGDGGTGASPLSSIRHAGLPWELGLSETHQTLLLNDLRSRVRLQTDGQLRTGRDAAIAAILGAEEFGFSTAALISLGCVMLRHCHLNNCAVGVATQDELLEKRFRGRVGYVASYFRFVAREMRETMAALGCRTVEEMVGRTDLLAVDPARLPWKAARLDCSRILHRPDVPAETGRHYAADRTRPAGRTLDRTLIARARPALAGGAAVSIAAPIRNSDRAVGAMLSGEICRRYGEEGLPEDTIRCAFRGTAGQSFGAWLTRGVTFELEGMANDYVGKGISGGKIVIRPDRDSRYEPAKNVVIGNTAFYGAISGQAYIRGIAGERFCIRNSGLYAVVEGVGDHGCEYMTGGRVVVLGATGRNFAAGMSGGIAYVYDPERLLENRVNREMVELDRLAEEDVPTLHDMIRSHLRHTGSAVAERILADFIPEIRRFAKVIPTEYRRMLEGTDVERTRELLGVADG